jgi:two-component sensor histidine kinase
MESPLGLVLSSRTPELFRWRHLCGTLEVFEGASTPRGDSPCGITLDQAAPVLTRHSERGYKWIADTNVKLLEVLLVPLYIDGPEPLGTLWVVSDVECHFDSGDARIATELAAFVGIALKMKRNEERLRRSLDTQELLTSEMSHRLKNVFALTQSMLRLGVKGAQDKHDLAETFSSRLRALASAHALVLPGLADNDTKSSDFGALLEAVLRPHQLANHLAGRVTLSGPGFDCDQRAVSSIALIIHELATNAAKYGSLKTDLGSVDLKWECDDNLLTLRWHELGGAPTAPPEQTGFGGRLVQGTVGQLKGSIDYDWRPDGVIIDISIPVASLATAAPLRR